MISRCVPMGAAWVVSLVILSSACKELTVSEVVGFSTVACGQGFR